MRPLKFYGDRRSHALRPAIRQDVLGLPSHVRQVSVLVAARKKADAVDYCEAAGLWIPEREIRVLQGNDVDAMTEAGLLTEGVVYAASRMHHAEGIARVTGAETATIVAKWAAPYPTPGRLGSIRVEVCA